MVYFATNLEGPRKNYDGPRRESGEQERRHRLKVGGGQPASQKLQLDADKKLSTLGPKTLRIWASRCLPHRLVLKMSDFLPF